MARRRARNVKQVRSEIFDDGDDPDNVPSRGLGWLLFRAPGALILWYRYYTGTGGVFLSGRQKGNVVMEVVFSIAFYVLIAFGTVLYLDS